MNCTIQYLVTIYQEGHNKKFSLFYQKNKLLNTMSLCFIAEDVFVTYSIPCLNEIDFTGYSNDQAM